MRVRADLRERHLLQHRLHGRLLVLQSVGQGRDLLAAGRRDELPSGDRRDRRGMRRGGDMHGSVGDVPGEWIDGKGDDVPSSDPRRM